MLTLRDIIRAYKDCRKHKSKSIYRAKFEYNLENNLYELFTKLKDRTYKIGRSICFVILEPKIREIWAADFQDRIVHHYLYNRIFDKYLRTFIK